MESFTGNESIKNNLIELWLDIGSRLKVSPGDFALLSLAQEMLEALKALSAFFVENSLRTRRNLRGDIERRSLAINEEFVSIFKEVKEVRICVLPL